MFSVTWLNQPFNYVNSSAAFTSCGVAVSTEEESHCCFSCYRATKDSESLCYLHTEGIVSQS